MSHFLSHVSGPIKVLSTILLLAEILLWIRLAHIHIRMVGVILRRKLAVLIGNAVFIYSALVYVIRTEALWGLIKRRLVVVLMMSGKNI